LAAIVTQDHDPLRTFSPEEEKRLTEQLFTLLSAIQRGDTKGRPLTITLLQDLHHALFANVRDHAGHLRGPGFGQEWVTFGPNRSVHRDRVKPELDRVLAEATRALASLDVEDPSFELEALRIGVKLHADIVRVHPFEDGNGRTSRLCLAHVLIECGLEVIPIEAVRQEYTEALNHYYNTRDIAPLVDLYIRLYPTTR
jgi:Fic family protein